ncbi:transmembrane anchor protein [Sphingomonas sp. R647]|jgi:hypothetical protein|uniref:transmembrane anchor protein n=1 Tax=unclassified Sphingomonas TaxID=196159 RepID=UPI001CD2D85B|nr:MULTISPECIES: transmembrane anchor protein [unclassified Sphingomonas]MCA1197885.1 transmembrane anchor protein [Sphingomonas sp. R647]MCR5871253.1 transmembrane anchor protein [Sphingomonas sp. J344]UUY00439.1 transmembrane anchor protein [Sphingomonas sp. J315]
MYNSQMPNADELPTSRQLVRSTAIAAGVAGALLVTIVLPSEYAIDPTGIGRVLGLTEMGEIKQQLAAEAAEEEAQAAAPTPSAMPVATSPAAKADATKAAAARTDEMKLTLAPGEAAEIKVTADAGAAIAFDWSVTGGHVNYDTHGDKIGAPRGFYHGYGKGKESTGERGTLVAAFDGGHGWFWRNRSGAPVTVTLKTSGNYAAIKRVV